jgi:hypothetical protein
MTRFPELPIVTPDPPRKTQAEKYGGLFYLGIAGLAVIVALVGWFAFGVWSMRSVWADTYTLADPRRPIGDRLDAAWRLARDERVTDRQKWELALDKNIPDLARYLLAESLTSEAVVDTRAYGLAIARSRGLPIWLRRLLIQPLASAAADGRTMDEETIQELARDQDPIIALWGRFLLVVSAPNPEATTARDELLEVSRSNRPTWSMALMLLDASKAEQPRRDQILHEARRLLRQNPESQAIWAGWVEISTGIRPEPARGLQKEAS